jgi:hypothetical protein
VDELDRKGGVEEEEEIKGLFKAKAVNEVDAGRDRVEEDS